MSKTFISAVLAVFWIFFGTYFWSCKIMQNCEEGFWGSFSLNETSNSAKKTKITPKKVEEKLIEPGGPITKFSISGNGYSIENKSGENITFDKNGINPEIPPSVVKNLNELKKYLIKNKNNRVKIVGHYKDSDIKPPGFNNIGLARAFKMKEYLMKFLKINPDQIDIATKRVNYPITLGDKVPGGLTWSIESSPDVAKKDNNKKIVAGKSSLSNSAKGNTNSAGTNSKQNESVKKAPVKRPAAIVKKAKTFEAYSIGQMKRGDKYLMKNITFAPGKFGPESSSFSELYDLINNLNTYGQTKIEIGVHVADSGNKAKDLEISTKRAESIRFFLMGKQIKYDRLESKGYGATQPVNRSNNVALKALNNRVEIKVK